MFFAHQLLNHALAWLVLLLLGVRNAESNNEEYGTYIIHMDRSQKPPSFFTHESWHLSVLKSLPNSGDHRKMLLYTYNHVIHGFSARLTPSQLFAIEKSPAHLATHRESFGKLYTTHSPKFLGLKRNSGLWPAASFGQGVIIGIIDTGIWPESDSFLDKGMPPVPQRWKGQCENGTSFSPSACNRKLIGARSFSKGLQASGINVSKEYDFESARDFFGHGTHTSSTAAGNQVDGVSHFGYAKGTARGVAPRAHVAMYKVLWATDSEESAASDVLAGMDQAIADGVDIMSLSLGFDQTPYFQDVIAIASLSAIDKGIVVVCAAGNDGTRQSIHNGAPWITTVGAGTLDRSFHATVSFDNGLTFKGISYFPQNIYISDAPLYYGKTDMNKSICHLESLRAEEVHGKVVFCDNSNRTDTYSQMQEVQRVGAYAAIFLTDTPDVDSSEYYIPSLILPTSAGISIRQYLTGRNDSKVKSMRFLLTEFGTKPAPQVASFSSRGPDPISPGILKPDILAPGVDVLAAVSPNVPYTEIGDYELVTDYALYSGTSMAAPHVAGIAALLKAIHWEWSPAAIRSAMMTTAYSVGTAENEIGAAPATPLDFGAGHIDPNKAMDPGLIYDTGFQDYVEFLCSVGYDEKQMKAVIRKNQWNCSQESADLNYPSFAATFTNETTAKNFSRVVTNVGAYDSIYHAVLEFPAGMKIRVEPISLKFSQKYQKQRFTLSVEIDSETPRVSFGYLKWIDQKNHTVTSAIVAIKT